MQRPHSIDPAQLRGQIGNLALEVTILATIRRAIDRLNSWIGRTVALLAILLVAEATLNAILRKLGKWFHTSLTSSGMLEVQWMLFAAIYLLGAAWTLRDDSHVRVDVAYERFGPRGKALVNLLGTLLLLLPFCWFALTGSWGHAVDSISQLEGDASSGFPIWPAWVLILMGFAMVGLQGVSVLIDSVGQLMGWTDIGNNEVEETS